ncbi:MAG: OmpH family outer membrane protein [Thermotogaceae bacterium]|nr:OmpH family outer membrane protein [Thermotogaceae bacterium]
MKKSWVVYITVFTGIFLVILAASDKESASLKIAYIDMPRVLQGYQPYKELMENYQNDLNFYKSKLQQLQDEITKLQNSGASQDEINKKKNEYVQKEQLFNQLLQQEYQPRMQQIQREIIGKAQRFGEESGFDVLLTNYPPGVVLSVLHVSDRVDVTEQFISYITKAEKSEK